MNKVLAITILGLVALTYVGLHSSGSTQIQDQFQDFIQTYKISYSNSGEYEFRLQTFTQNLDKIADLNRRNPKAVFAVNQFTDRTPEEMKQMLGRRNTPNRGHCVDKEESGTPTSIDWKKLMGDLKNQASCGSCWAFASSAVAEGRYALSKGQKTVTTRFSEQQLVDCDKVNDGCEGGEEKDAFVFWEQHDICLEKDYKYTAEDGECHGECHTGIKIAECTNLKAINSDIVIELQNGPVDVGVDASTWSSYSSGIVEDCDVSSLNHAVTLVGYNSDEGSVTIRNSWGSSWGEEGHIRLAYNSDACGWLDDAHSITF